MKNRADRVKKDWKYILKTAVKKYGLIVQGYTCDEGNNCRFFILP
jgi:hypothetical protein